MATYKGTTANDTLVGAVTNDYLYGYEGNDSLNGGDGNDLLDGGSGNDTMVGGQGNDVYYLDSVSDVVIENAGEGTDTVYLSATSYNFSTIFIDRIYMLNNAVTVTANSVANYIKGSDLANTINGLAGNDTIYAGLGNDTVNGGDDNDIIFGEAGNDLLNGDLGDDRLYGGNDTDTLNGGDGNDTLSGGLGADSMTGGLGNDTYYVDNVGDVVVENSGEGVDRIISEISWTLGNNIENLILTSTANLTATGNSLDNVLTGNVGNNTLTGGAGNDTLNGKEGNDSMIGGIGDDRYYVDSSGDAVVENAGEGTDTVYSTITYTLANTLERLVLLGDIAIDGTGNALDNLIVGNDNNNSLTGAAGNDTLRGGGGNDTMVGGVGNDVYYVDAEDNTSTLAVEGDVVVENANEGTDTVYSEVTYTAVANLENVYLLGTNNINVSGNSLNNVLRGNTGNNILDGKAGRDLMYGGAGDDIYYVDDANDKVFELVSEGIDTIITGLTGYTLAANVENLIITGTSGRSITGNTSDNSIMGGTGNDTLNGGDGNDTLFGGAGNDSMLGGLGSDIYYVDSASDIVDETGGGGTDTVYSSITYTLGAGIENLVLTGSGTINGTGNSLANTITGNNLSNVLNGGTGADTLIGADGNDYYYVDSGDVVTENLGEGLDTVETDVNNYVLAANVENLILGTTAATVTANDSDNTITANPVANVVNNNITAMGGADIVYGNAGNDTIDGGTENDILYGDDLAGTVSGADSLIGGAGNDSLYGGGGNDTLNGGADNDLLNGGAGVDSMIGGAGDDTYYVDSTSDVVVENASEGVDTIIASATYSIATAGNVENISITTTGTITGNGLANVLNADNGLANTLDGGAGDDAYYIDSSDTINADSGGVDTVYSSGSYTLSASLDRLTLTGSSAISGTGNSGSNIITGNKSNNTLIGGGGTDTLAGGVGDDTYVFTSAASFQNVTIQENANEGTDYLKVSGITSVNLSNSQVNGVVQSGFSMTGIEGVYIDGSTGVTVTGASTNDRLISSIGRGNALNGGAGNDILDSSAGGGTGETGQYGSGGDTLDGGNGSDTYYVSTYDYYRTGVWVTFGWYDVPETAPSLQDTINDTGTGSTDSDTVYINWVDENSDLGALVGGDYIDSVTVTAGGARLVGIENIIFQGTDESKNADGNGSNNYLAGGTGANTLRGYGGNDNLFGNGGNDNLDGGDGNDTLDGGNGNDTMTGGNGDDIFYVDSAGDVINADTSGTDTVYSKVSFTIGTSIENLILTGSDAINATGHTGNNLIKGNEGNNSLSGGGGVDTMEGGNGDDIYVVDSTTDVVTENIGAGTDLIQTSVSYTLSANVENITLTGTSVINGTGNALDNILTGNSAANVLAGGDGDDSYYADQNDTITELADEGIDTVYFNATAGVNKTIYAEVERLILTGSTASVNAVGDSRNNDLRGSSHSGANSLTGGAGDDTYYVGTSDVVVETSGNGTDTVYVDNQNFTGTLNNVENVYTANFSAGRTITLTGTTTALNILGSTFSDSIVGGNNNDTLNGGGGNDTLDGGAGNDSYYIDGGETLVDSGGTDTVFSAITYTIAGTIEDLTLTGSANINATGNAANNTLTGNSGINVLTGGNGSDTYIIDSASDTVVETLASFDDFTKGLPAATYTMIGGSSPGTETVDKAFDDNTSTKYLNSTGAGTGIGIDFGAAVIATSLGLTTANDAAYRDPKTYTLYGSNSSINDTTNTLSSGTLPTITARLTDFPTINFSNSVAYRFYRLIFNTIVGGGGDSNVQISEVRLSGNTGTDTIQSSVSYTLPTNVENIILTGTANISATGNGDNNVLTGNTGNNTLDGGAGTDTMIGGAGDDTYYISVAGDTITENSNEGLDTVITGISYTLGANVENLIATAVSLTLTGNTLDNTITSLGGAGSTLVGGAGNDLFVVNNTTDVVTELAGEGRDAIQTAVSYTLAANVEDITLLEGSGAATATGNTLDNVLMGNSNLNTLTGGAGDDTYFVDQTADVVVENVNEGTDTVNASATFTLVANIENLILIGSAAINGTGNSSNNMIIGGTGNNSITGGGGDDTLSGGQGTDTLNAGVTGNTTYNFIRNDAIDTIIDGGGNDILNFANMDISYTQLWFKQTGNDLEIDIIGTSDTVYIKDWYLSTANRVEVINSGDAYTLSSTDVQQLVQAMSTLTQPVLGETGLPPETYDALEMTFYGAWKPV